MEIRTVRKSPKGRNGKRPKSKGSIYTNNYIGKKVYILTKEEYIELKRG